MFHFQSILNRQDMKDMKAEHSLDCKFQVDIQVLEQILQDKMYREGKNTLRNLVVWVKLLRLRMQNLQRKDLP